MQISTSWYFSNRSIEVLFISWKKNKIHRYMSLPLAQRHWDLLRVSWWGVASVCSSYKNLFGSFVCCVLVFGQPDSGSWWAVRLITERLGWIALIVSVPWSMYWHLQFVTVFVISISSVCLPWDKPNDANFCSAVEMSLTIDSNFDSCYSSYSDKNALDWTFKVKFCCQNWEIIIYTVL